VTLKKTLSMKYALIFEFQTSRHRVGLHDGYIKIYEMAVSLGGTLGGAYTVGVVADRARNLFQMLAVLREALITQYAVAAVALVAKLVSVFAFSRIVGGFISMGEQGGIV